MNINQIKAFCWLASAGLTVGVGYYVYDFQQRQKEWVNQYRIPKETAQSILESAQVPERPKTALVSREAIERSYYYDPRNRQLPNLLDWTGAPPKVVEEKPVVVDVVPEVRIEKVGDKLAVMMIVEDQLLPKLSRAWIKYTDDSGVPQPTDPAKLELLKVGDKLKAPLDYATLKGNSANEGLTFSFQVGEGDQPRDDEVVPYLQYDPGSVVYDAQGKAYEPVRPDIPRRQAVWRPEHTTKLNDNSWIIGSQDQAEFAEDFGGIIAREVRHARHYNSKTGKYDGIELKEVKPGGKIAAHGGQTGDIIKSINGHPVTSASEAISFVKNNQDKYDKWIVVVENKGKERTMTFESPPSE